MFGIGIQELLIILVVALLVLGPTKLPGVARSLGKGLKELRKASDDLRGALMIDEDEPRRRYTPPPKVADAPLSDVESANAAPGIHGSLAAGAATVAGADDDDDGAPATARDDDDIVSRGQEGGDPHKRALDPPARTRADDDDGRGADGASQTDAHDGLVPSDPAVTAMLEDARRQAAGARTDARGGVAAARAEQARGDDARAEKPASVAQNDKDATT